MAKNSSGINFVTAEKALDCLKSGQRVFIGSGTAEPQHLVRVFSEKVSPLADIEVVHILTVGTAPYADRSFVGKVRHNALFIGANMREAVGAGLADYTPCFLHEIPKMFRNGKLPIDVALIQTTYPRQGLCSLGVAVDIIKAAAESASYVIAQVNDQMPWTNGDSYIHVDDIDAFVEYSEPILELDIPENTAVAAWIGKYVSRLIEDGSTLQLGIGAIPNAVLSELGNKRNLGIHSEMVSDGILPLIESGVINGKCKTIHRNKIVVSFCMGTKALYDAVNDSPLFEFYPCDYVNDPFVIAKNNKMVSINSALQVDLTGQVAADSIGTRFYSGVGGQVDFIRGAAGSKGGRSIIGLPATAKGGTVSRIVPVLTEGTGVVTTRADVDFVVTEYGIASLKGKTIRERAIALIQIAHPSFRKSLAERAAELGYIDSNQILPLEAERYRVDLERNREFGGLNVFFRPIKPTDEKKLRELFYSQSERTTYMRFGMHVKNLSSEQFQKLVAIDYHNSMAIGGFVKVGGRERLIAVGRYYLEYDGTSAEVAFTVHDEYQGRGIGKYMVELIGSIAKKEGITKLKAVVLDENIRMKQIFKELFGSFEQERVGDRLCITIDIASWHDAQTVQD
ncbi:MAG: GNAT family N-acetyltransferase [Candidatus Dadabacteria bacterium]|nr:MAG: GNAT family N-acetyltransferase [Candidatus Dadabacteria bacterium]